MGLLNRPRVVPMVDVDVAAAEKWDRMGLLARLLTDALSQERAAYMKHHHALWKRAGLDRAPKKEEWNPMLASNWMPKK